MKRAAAYLILVGLLVAPCSAWARYIDFPFQDGQLLQPGQSKGGRIWLPDSAKKGTPYTLVVLLHGLNPDGKMHPLLNQEKIDIAGVASRLIQSGDVRQSFILAAPTQSRNAEKSGTLWVRFDLRAFIRQVKKALPKGYVLGDRPVVMGHSGAGCNPDCGLWWVAKQHGGWLRAMATMDTCMTRAFGEHLWRFLWPSPKDPEAKGRGQTWLINFWQTGWERDADGYENAMEFKLLADKGPRETNRLKRNSRRWLSARVDRDHAKIVESIFDEALRHIFPTPRQLTQLENELATTKRVREQEKAAEVRKAAERRKQEAVAKRKAAQEAERARQAAQRQRKEAERAGKRAAQQGANQPGADSGAASAPAHGTAAAPAPQAPAAPPASPAPAP